MVCVCMCVCSRLFLLRDSQSNPKAYVLTLCHHQKIKHFQILPVSHLIIWRQMIIITINNYSH